MTAKFEGKTALVTGGTRGIGFGIAAEVVAGGGRVCITARKPDELTGAVEALGGEEVALAVRGSADDAEHRSDAVAQTIKRFGSLDLLVNNAAVNPHYGLVMDAPLDAVRKVFEVNVTGMLAWAQEAWRAWMSENGGAIVNVASVGGVRNGPMIGVYNVSKAAVIHLTKQMAMEMGPGVRVNAIAPAVVKTKFAKALYEGREEEVAAAYPLKRLGQPEDTSKLAAFLLSDDASWITGETVVIDGGISVSGR
ncbi:MAG: SDR family oxidoreductase [Mycobacteriales bacterium]